ncbi:hypothetical protein TrLO_g9991 [Triparma laevis f. longispina]|uniref:EF-hand domain-containing protein n=1 Tax=Triparma laevis f. longispina TaxID=1714387 RepID=A0A9W7AUQ0_9STRA|nr:hypothetical protein TrLO_g9991 [Triparma laevis f. longispina]
MLSASQFARIGARFGVYRLLLPLVVSNFSDAAGNPAVDKLVGIFESYRAANYNQTLPSRYAKEVVAAADKDGDGVLTKDEISGVFANIGADTEMSTTEIEEAVSALAGGDGVLSSAEFIAVLSKK